MNLLYFFWPILYFTNKHHKVPEKINRNYLSFTHSAICTVISYSNLYLLPESSFMNTLLFYYSSSYFIWDNLYIIYNKIWSDLPYIYHHFVCLLMLYELNIGNNISELTNIFYIGELSNFFNYIVYHMIKTKYNKKHIAVTKILQLIWFGYFRLYSLTNIGLTNFYKFENRLLAYTLVSIYLLGIGWSYKQARLTFNSVKSLITKPKNI